MNRARQFFWQALQGLNLRKSERQQRFQDMIDQFLERWSQFSVAPPSAPVKDSIGIVVLPWLQTAVPLYSLECARELAAAGKSVTIIWDTANVFDSAINTWELALLEKLIAAVRKKFPVISPADVPAGRGDDREQFQQLLSEAAVQKMRGELGSKELLERRPDWEESLCRQFARVRALLKEHRFERLILPGGFWAVSGVYSTVATELGLSFVTYDCGPGSLFLGRDSVAAHSLDIGETARRLIRETAEDDGERKRIVEIARRQLDIRMKGKDEYRVQPVAASEATGPQYDVLLLLNLRWDSAALCRHRLFSNVTDWITQVLAWGESHPTARIAIRQHPCERLPGFGGTDDYGRLLPNHPRLAGRVTYLSAHETVNTYDLLARAKAALPFTSRVGVEAGLLGCPVILGSKCYYADCGFGWYPRTGAEYFACLDKAMENQLIVTDEAREAAMVTYYLAECCMELKTRFTPAPVDFAEWVKIPPAELWKRPENVDVLEAFTGDESMVSIRHQRLKRESLAAVN